MRATPTTGMRLLLLLLLLLFWAEHTTGSSFSPNCLTGYNTGETLDFAENPGNYDVTCKNAYVELTCCVKGYTSMKWYKKSSGNWAEIELNPMMYYEKNDLNQTLTIRQPLKEYDEGDYMCVAEDSKDNRINNTITLEVRDCDGQLTAPEALDPTEGTVQRPLGSSVKIRCVGFFGRQHQKTLGDIYWRKTRYNSTGHLIQDFWIPHKNLLLPTAPNINITYNSTTAHIKSSIIISNITEEDFANYTCQMMNVIGTVLRTVELVEGNGTEPTVVIKKIDDPKWQWVVIGLFVVLLAVAIAGLLVFCFLLDIKLYIRDRFGKVVDDGKECDAFIVYNSEDDGDRRFVVRHVVNVLEKQHGYKLFLSDRDFPVGAPIASNFMLGVKKCRCIMFLMSPALLNEEWVDYLYLSTAERMDISRVFLIYRKLDDSHWQSHQDAFKTAFRVAKRKVRWPEYQSSAEVSSLPDQRSTSSYNRMSKGEVKFWKQLRWYLPKPLSLVRSQQQNIISTTKSHKTKSKSSKSTQPPLAQTKSSGSPYAFELI